LVFVELEETFRLEFLVDRESKDGVRLGLLREEFYKYGGINE
jgi:hypothetical protein